MMSNSNNSNNNNNNENEPSSSSLWSIEIPSTSIPNYRGNIRRSYDPYASPTLAIDGCFTLYECLHRGYELNPLGPCLGFRAISSNTGFATPFVYLSYTEVMARVNSFSAGLNYLKLIDNKNEDDMMLLGIYMKNCPEWIIAEHGCYSLGGITVPFYDTLGVSTVEYILSNTSTPCVVCTRNELPRLCDAKTSQRKEKKQQEEEGDGDNNNNKDDEENNNDSLPTSSSSSCPNFHHVILIDGVTPEAAHMAQNVGLNVVSMAKVEALGAQILATNGNEHIHHPPSGHDIATFCYTSGTTGNPKGALITHTNLVSVMSAVRGVGLDINLNDRHLSYLPLPHIFERSVLNSILAAGGCVGFFRGDTTKLIEDIVACRPTFLPVAPRVLNKIYDKIMAGINATGGLKKKLFDKALQTKTFNLYKHGQLTHSIYDKLIFNKIKVALGMDHLRYMISGSAPLSQTVMTFFRCLLSIPVLEGYGQTEGAAGATLSHVEDLNTVGHVGGPISGVEIVLVDIPEMGYYHTDTNHDNCKIQCMGRGEVCIRGPNVFKGYYKDLVKTNETIDKDGWLHSGDVGLWTMEGTLQIIDRVKNIFKLSQGEYIAVEKIENLLMQCNFISQIFVYGDSYQSYLIAIVVLDEEVVTKWANDIDPQTLGKLSLQEICNNELLNGEILMEFNNISQKNNLQKFEYIRNIYLEHVPFSVENGLLTPTFKLKRQQLKEYYKTQIDDMYNKIKKKEDVIMQSSLSTPLHSKL